MENQLRSHGFTLVELIVVMVVMGILAAVFIPRSNNPAIIVSTQAEQLAADIRYLQSLAMTQGWNGTVPRHYRINFTPTTYYFADDFGGVAHPSGTTAAIAYAGGVSSTLSNLPNNLVSFDGLGAPHTDIGVSTSLAATATISLTSGGTTLLVCIYQETGMVRVASGTCT